MKSKNLLKKCIFLVVMALIIFAVLLIVVRYEVEGEKEMPFDLSKILIVSSVNGNPNEDSENIWNISVSETNDIYIYIDRDEGSKELIKSVSLENFDIENLTSTERDYKIYRPTGEMENLYSKSEADYKEDVISYQGSKIDDLKALEVSNIGGMVAFRFSEENLGTFTSNEEGLEIHYDGNLLTNLGITVDDVKAKLGFDIIIETVSGIKYKGTVEVTVPGDDLITNGSSTIELTNFDEVIFKRV